MRNVISLAALLVAAGASNAAITGVEWRAVDNSAAATNIGWNTANKTFDLYIIGAVGDIVNGVSAGGDGNANYGINVAGGTVFNHAQGANVRSPAFESFPGFESLRFDTFCSYEGNVSANTPGSNAGQATQFAGVTDLVAADGRMNFSSFTQPPIALTADALSSGGGSLRVLRVTVSGSTTHLGGDVGADIASRVQIGLPGGVVTDFVVGNAIPAPTAVALFGLAGLAAARRRR